MTPPRNDRGSTDRSSTFTDWWYRTRYQFYAPLYRLAARPLENGRRRAIERIAPTPGDRILILGSGPGMDLPHLPREASISALDAAPAMVRRTKARARELGMNVDARVADARNLPYEGNTFDVVLLHLILAVVPNPEAVAHEVARVLKPSGRVSIYDKFIPDGTEPSLLRRALNPVTRFLFSDITQSLGPIFSDTNLEIGERETALGGLYTITSARPLQSS